MSAAPVDWMRRHAEWGILDPSSEQPGFGQCLWNVEAHKMCKTTPPNGARTLVELLEKAKDGFRDRPAVGWRNVVRVHQVEEGGAKREKIELENQYQWLTYGDYYERVLKLARGLALVGVKPLDKVVIYAETQRDWMVAANAAWRSNAQVVTIYATLGAEGAIHGINETEATTVIADAKLLKVLIKVLPKCKSVQHVITMDECDPDLGPSFLKEAGVNLRSIEETINQGATWSYTQTLPQPEDVAVIMYTSGTTGAPKGVVLSHANITAVVAAVDHALAGAVNHEDVYMAYLPLAHIMEMAAEICFMSMGCAIGYGTPHTLTDTGLKLKRPESSGDAPLLQPTFMVFAPAVLDKVYQSVINKRDSLGAVGRKLFSWGLASGERHFGRGQIGANRIYNGVVFKKVQKIVGGRLKMMLTGSAPLSPDIQKFCQTVFDVPVRQGYGLTETCAGSCVAFWGDNSTSCVGPPTVSTVVRLADWPEGNYMNSDKDKPEFGMRRGEILIGGPTVSQGYFISPTRPNEELQKKNAEDWVTIDGIRFFRSGDIGQIRPNGTLEIIDRKKDLWKGPNGEYVALTKVEAALKLCEFVDMPMCYGKTGGEFPVGLICPQKPRIMNLATELGVDGDFPELCRNEAILRRVAEACRAKCKEQRLADFETPKKYALISDLWTPENDMLTAAMKLKRPLIVEKHREEIGQLYSA
mmetsp:Transcript_122926/g.244518  ORF Transcript_122926/g.244518 Transcript_122926/m.244518 type:complete len:698 (-) Transcript_122926:303-2396(-)